MRVPAALFSLILAAVPAHAQDLNAQIAAKVEGEFRAWAADPALVAAIKASNVAHHDLSEEDILALDKTWRAEIDAATQPTVDAILGTPESKALHEKVESSLGRISEIIVMDDRGLNVAQASATSDFWQGDEEKYQDTYLKGADAIHVSAIEFDESSQTYQVQASFTVTDPETGAPIGAMTVGLNAEMIE
ncbi:hypothetical protein [Rhodobacter maris]|uniref:Uncharacterized protein n=1 Tax=Rhodobacter maris TaxID=446682 RepID=A0A285RIT6_9RHOB|nr:hypothetical protein [Rhodobacter maris]SOB93784.1 hypothetical protein SAMN05877831_101248 [Rhodobacter maris]